MKNQYSLESLIGAFRKAFSDRKFIPNKTPLVFDMKESENTLEPEGVHHLIKYIAKNRVSRVAIMVSDLMHFGIARLCYRFYYTEGIRAKVFTEPIKAKAFCSGVEVELEQSLQYAN